MDKNSSFGKRNWLIVVGLVLLIALVAAAARLLPASEHEPPEDPETAAPLSSAERSLEQSVSKPTANGYLYIILNNRNWGIEALNVERNVTVDQGNGVVNVIHLLPDGFYMESSTCDNQLCITEGTVTTQNYQTRFLGPCVYCLPHGLQLELVVPNATRSPDAVDN